MRKYCSEHQRDWDEFIPSAVFAYNSSPMTNSVHFTPFHMLFGREARNPCDIDLTPRDMISRSTDAHMEKTITRMHEAHAEARERLIKHQAHMKEVYDRKCSNYTCSYRVGQLVYLFVPIIKLGLTRKLTRRWKGPFVLVEKTSPVNFRLKWAVGGKQLPNLMQVNRMKLVIARHERPREEEEPDTEEGRSPLAGEVTDTILREEESLGQVEATEGVVTGRSLMTQ